MPTTRFHRLCRRTGAVHGHHVALRCRDVAQCLTCHHRHAEIITMAAHGFQHRPRRTTCLQRDTGVSHRRQVPQRRASHPHQRRIFNVNMQGSYDCLSQPGCLQRRAVCLVCRQVDNRVAACGCHAAAPPRPHRQRRRQTNMRATRHQVRPLPCRRCRCHCSAHFTRARLCLDLRVPRATCRRANCRYCCHSWVGKIVSRKLHFIFDKPR